MTSYVQFLESKKVRPKAIGFDPIWMPDFLFDFQKYLVEWALKKGRCALFEDCGLGKTPQSLVWAENVVRKTNGNVLIVCPLAVSSQFVREGEKFGIEVVRSRNGLVSRGISVTNYERLHYFDSSDFTGIVLDESSILKNFDGKTRRTITDFMRPIKYRLLCTATPAPNDHMELGTTSEALGVMGRNQMLGMFFVNDGKTVSQWRLKGHARRRFWQWMSGWARAIRKPSDLGFDDGKFILPELNVVQHMVPAGSIEGFLPKIANTLSEQRQERRKTLQSRCEKVAEVIPEDKPCVVWCHLNDEGDLLEQLIPDAVQVKGSDRDDKKERDLYGFTQGQIRVLVTKPTIAGFGLNWQHCHTMSFFPSHSHEQFYQAIRRCYRFGQDHVVDCHMITSEAERRVVGNMLRKEKQAVELYEGIVREMGRHTDEDKDRNNGQLNMEIPRWM